MKILRRFTLMGLAFAVMTATAWAQAPRFLNGRAVEVSDGDTLRLQADGEFYSIRFYGVDCPEKASGSRWPAQPRWEQARDFVQGLVMGKDVTVRLTGERTYDREVGEVFVEGKSVSRELLRSGWGWWYEFYSEADGDLARLEAAAKDARSGIWQDSDAIAPWTWRRMDHAPGDTGGNPAVVGPSGLSDYYAPAEGLSGNALRATLSDIISDQKVLSYGAVWDALKYTDEDPENPNNVKEFYTGWSLPKDNNGGGRDQWNREHVWAKSRGDFGTSPGPGTDIHHLRPTDATVNSARGNKAFDDGGTEYRDDNRPTGCKTDGNSWEPRDEVKGDVARMMFYMDVRYEDGPDLKLVEAEENQKRPLHGKLAALLRWHQEDPVSDDERRRNERIFELQENRNPFIDHPEFVALIWGNN